MTEGRRDRSPTVEGTRELLAYLTADCSYDRWVEIAMAIKSGLGEAGWPVFEEWSQSGASYDPRTCRATWDSIQATGAVTYGTLVHHARVAGWRPSKRNTRRSGSRPRHSGRTLSRAREYAGRGARPAPNAERGTEPPTAEVARAILAAAVPADATLASVYLARRGTWPPITVGPDLPTTVRWLEADMVKELPSWTRNGRRRRLVLPADAAGVVVFEFARPGQPPDGVSLTAVAGTGDRVLFGREKARTFGGKAGRVFEAANTPGGHVVLAEGECDALALALTLRAGCVRSVGGTSGFRPEAAADPARRSVALVPDTEKSGEAAITGLLTDLPERSVTVVPWPRVAVGDPAAWLADWVYERAGVRELDGGMDRVAASVAAWNDLLAAIERSDTILIDLENHD